MECGKLTAKLRDAVPVCFMEGGREIKRYKNIEIPDEIKRLPFEDFKFDVPMNGGAITFKIHFKPGILPEEWPEARERKSRKAKAETTAVAVIEAAEEAPDADAEDTAEATKIMEATDVEETIDPQPMELTIAERAYNATGDRRKALVQAIAEATGEDAKYQNAPSFAYQIGEYTVDKNGTVSGPDDPALWAALEEQGFTVEE